MKFYFFVLMGLIESLSFAQGGNLAKGKLVDVVDESKEPINIIYSLGIQSRRPIAIVVGRRQNALCDTSKEIIVKQKQLLDTLQNVSSFTGYTLSQTNNMYTFIAPDVEPVQLKVLNYRLDKFPTMDNVTVEELIAKLNIWIAMVVGGEKSYAGHIKIAHSSMRYSFKEMQNPSIQEVANKIASLGKGGMWVMRLRTASPKSAKDIEFQIYSYENIHEIACAP